MNKGNYNYYKCINNKNLESELTLYILYTVYKEKNGRIYIRNEKGIYKWYDVSIFQLV